MTFASEREKLIVVGLLLLALAVEGWMLWTLLSARRCDSESRRQNGAVTGTEALRSPEKGLQRHT